MDQPRVECVFRLMRLMAGNTYYTIEELAKKLDITERSVYGLETVVLGASVHFVIISLSL